MKPFVVGSCAACRGKVSIPGDKSIAHRAVILSCLARGKTRIENFPANKDCLSTVNAFKKLGIKIIFHRPDTIEVFGKGPSGLKKPKGPIFIGESGTTYRLLLGVLAGQDFKTLLTAGRSLSLRPMARVTRPLRLMGAKINSKLKTQNSKQEEYPPITIRGAALKPISYKMPVASAQVKSAISLAGLFAKGKTTVIEPLKTRDHTERMLRLFKARLQVKGNKISVEGNRELVSPKKICVPADISSAAFFMVAASLLPKSRILIRNVSLNPTRTGILKVLKRMGADIKLKTQNSKLKTDEPSGDLVVKSSKLKGTVIRKEEIPSLIDELPILMVAASAARGRSVFAGVGELRIKETDRIRSMTQNLKKMGADIRILRDKGRESIVIQGQRQLKGVNVKSFGDHRTAMSMVIAGLIARGKTDIDDVSCIDKSFPDFLKQLTALVR